MELQRTTVHGTPMHHSARSASAPQCMELQRTTMHGTPMHHSARSASATQLYGAVKGCRQCRTRPPLSLPLFPALLFLKPTSTPYFFLRSRSISRRFFIPLFLTLAGGRVRGRWAGAWQ
eukprot:137970-Chlamydomonas_euryale.AAC.1